MTKPTVILHPCPTYDPQRIERIVTEGLERLELRPHGRTLVKPNCVASGPQFPHAYTRPEFLEGVLRALKGRASSDLTELALGERCGITIPTRFSFKGAGYYELLDRVGGVQAYHFEECTQVEIPLYHPQRLRDSFFTPEPVAKADFFVNCPKFKAHPWTTVTFSMKNYIGIQDDRHRLIDHDHKLNEKVADLQYIIQPQFIAIDAITAGEGRMLTPIPFDLGLVIMGNNQVAFDAVCCHIIGLDPLSVDHIRMAHERGFGPVKLEDIQIVGELTLEQAQARAKGFRTGLIRVEEYFKDTHIRAYAGPPPEGTSSDYCWGGCPGALEEAIEILRQYDQAADRKIAESKRLHVVFGKYEGTLDVKADEKVVFIGDCASFKGEVAGKPVELPSIYEDRSKKSPYQAKSEDVLYKMVKVNGQWLANQGKQVTRMAGCPVSVSEQVMLLVRTMKMNDPFLGPEAPVFMSCYFSSRLKTTISRLMGKPYQQAGATERGAARPSQNLPPQGISTPLEKQPQP
jgi:uncharacterized protein (DUF362 family)